jgi:hypothetical protein
MFETVNEAVRNNAREYWNSELNLDQKSLSDRRGFEAWLSKMYPSVSKWPIFRRTLMPNVACFDLTREFELVLSQVAEQLVRHTRLIPRLRPKPYKFSSLFLCRFSSSGFVYLEARF